MATKTTKTTKTAPATKKAPAKVAKKPATKARAKVVAPPSLTEALSAAGSRVWQNDHVRTGLKIGIGAAVGAVLTKTVFA